MRGTGRGGDRIERRDRLGHRRPLHRGRRRRRRARPARRRRRVADPTTARAAADRDRRRARPHRRAVQQRGHRRGRRRRRVDTRGLATGVRGQRVRRRQHVAAPCCPRCAPPGRGAVVNTCSVVASVGLVDRAVYSRVEGRGARADPRDGRRRDPPRHPRQLRLAGHGREPVGRADGRRARPIPRPASRRSRRRQPLGRHGDRATRSRPRSSTSPTTRRSRPAPTSCSTAASPACASSTDGDDAHTGSTTPASACSSTGTTRASAGSKCRGRWSAACSRLPHCQSVTPDEYHALAATFDPAAFDAADLARRAREAGMRYVVFTTRHHNGFSMFDSALERPHGDALAVRARHRARGGRRVPRRGAADRLLLLALGLASSRLPGVPRGGQAVPSRRLAARARPTSRPTASAPTCSASCASCSPATGRSTCSGSTGSGSDRRDWWRVDEIAALARELQPGILINDRLPGHGDFLTPEQFVPATAPGDRWETCFTMNDSWGWNPDDTNYKSPRAIVHALCETAGRGGNLLLNVSPRGDGALPRRADRTARRGRPRGWPAHHTAIHDTDAGPRAVAVLRTVDAPRRPHPR